MSFSSQLLVCSFIPSYDSSPYYIFHSLLIANLSQEKAEITETGEPNFIILILGVELLNL